MRLFPLVAAAVLLSTLSLPAVAQDTRDEDARIVFAYAGWGTYDLRETVWQSFGGPCETEVQPGTHLTTACFDVLAGEARLSLEIRPPSLDGYTQTEPVELLWLDAAGAIVYQQTVCFLWDGGTLWQGESLPVPDDDVRRVAVTPGVPDPGCFNNKGPYVDIRASFW